jgi:hypothetical protein
MKVAFAYFGNNLFVIEQEIEIRRRDETCNWLQIDKQQN